MKRFDPLELDPRKARAELDELKALLDGQPDLREREHVLPFFRARPHLSALIGFYFPYIGVPDRIAFEYDLFGDFAADLAVGDAAAGHYCFVEFEDATPASLFVQKGTKATLEWSPRFEHGFSQVLDWLWKLADVRGTVAFEDRFGVSHAGYEGLLVIGRSGGLGPKERHRLRWRRERVVADSKHVHVVTYDELHQHLDAKLRLLELSLASGAE